MYRSCGAAASFPCAAASTLGPCLPPRRNGARHRRSRPSLRLAPRRCWSTATSYHLFQSPFTNVREVFASDLPTSINSCEKTSRVKLYVDLRLPSTDARLCPLALALLWPDT